MVALSILILSILSVSTISTQYAILFSSIYFLSSLLTFAEHFLESLISYGGGSIPISFMITPAVNTGPIKQPLPASSKPISSLSFS